EVTVLYEETEAAAGMRRVDTATVSMLSTVPPTSTIEEARDMLSNRREDATKVDGKIRVPGAKMPWGVCISNFGFVSMSAITLLLGVFDVKDFSGRHRSMIKWIEGPVREIDEEFASCMSDILMNQSGVMTRSFQPTPRFHISLRTLCDLVGERYINDDIVSGIMRLFTIHYGADGRHLFVPHWTFQGWQGLMGRASSFSLEWEKERMAGRKVEKIFAIAHMA